MLVLGRRKDEAICIGDDIRIMIVRVDGGLVRVGVEAPENISVFREELAAEGFRRDGRKR